MPSYHDVPQGDMYIEYSVVFPTEISGASRASEFDRSETLTPFCLPAASSPHASSRDAVVNSVRLQLAELAEVFDTGSHGTFWRKDEL